MVISNYSKLTFKVPLNNNSLPKGNFRYSPGSHQAPMQMIIHLLLIKPMDESRLELTLCMLTLRLNPIAFGFKEQRK